MHVGILALQGAVEPHEEKLRALEVTPVQVRWPADLKGLSGIVLPGGESTTFIHLLKHNALWDPLEEFLVSRPALAVCAGAILLAKGVQSPPQPSLGLMDIEIERNAFGRQVESFIAPLEGTQEWEGREPFEGVFIRAPRIRSVGNGVKTLFCHEGEPVMVEEKNLLATTFHPELVDSIQIHEYFLRKMAH